MGLIAQAKMDIEQITSNQDDFGIEMTFTAPTGEIVIVTGLHTKHHFAIDGDGKMINSKNAHVSVSEKFLTDQAYPVRNIKGEVSLKDHRVAVKDSTGTICNYKIKEWFPNETVGLITCLFEIFE